MTPLHLLHLLALTTSFFLSLPTFVSSQDPPPLQVLPDSVLNTTNTTNQTLHIAGLYDLTSFPDWPTHLLNFTVQLINNKTDGWHDDVLTDGSTLTFTMNNSACDADAAVRSYLGMIRNGLRPNGIFGCRCSGASMAVARLCAVENIPILSPASTSVKLSEKEEYSTFSRLVGPDNDGGQVGALISLLRSFGWNRISIINTDTQFTKDIALELSDAWKGNHEGEEDPFIGEIAYTDTIKLNKTTNLIDKESARRVLNNVPVHKSAVNSRVIVLFAHNQHAFPILQCARDLNFQPDTIWVGTSEWVGREPLDGDVRWMPPIPGYLGLSPYRNTTTPQYLDFLGRLQHYERTNFIQPMTEDLEDYVADRVIDGTLALAKAFVAVPPEQRDDGELISREMRKLTFEGLSGPIAFHPNGDFKDPRYTVVTMASRGEGWTPVGFATPSMAEIAIDKVCYAEVGCVSSIPDDSYPPEKDLLPFWIWIVIGLLVMITILLYIQRQKSNSVRSKLSKIEDELAALENNDDAVKLKKGRLYKEIATLLDQPTPSHWTRNAKNRVVNVTPLDEEYWNVLKQLRDTMTPGETVHLSHVSRIQNEGIWSYYVFRKNQLANKYGVDLQNTDALIEASVWHGTSSLNPDVIYRDEQDGFMMQLSQQGHWGRGIYFSERSGYSDPYAFKPLTEHHEGDQQDRELILVKLLVGEAILLDRTEGEWMAEACKTLCTPPDNPNFNGYKFDTVTGIVEDEAKTKVYVVYENGRAYPEYLVRYYKGDRDPSRTPFESWEEVLEEKENQKSEEPKETKTSNIFRQLQDITSTASSKFIGQSQFESAQASNVSALGMDDDDSEGDEVEAKGIWQYQDDADKWINYLNGHQIQLETAYQEDKNGVTTIDTFPWTYAIDFSVNLQTNLDHPEKKTRSIRRIHIDHMDASHRNPRSSSSFRFSTRCTPSKSRLMHPEAILEGLGEGSSGQLSELSKAEDDVEALGDATAASAAPTPDDTTALSSDSYHIGGRDGNMRSTQSIDELKEYADADSADAGAGTAAANLRSSMSDEQAASIASSLASLYPSTRDMMTESNASSMNSLYPSARDVASAGGNSMRSFMTEPAVASRPSGRDSTDVAMTSTSSLPVARTTSGREEMASTSSLPVARTPRPRPSLADGPVTEPTMLASGNEATTSTSGPPAPRPSNNGAMNSTPSLRDVYLPVASPTQSRPSFVDDDPFIAPFSARIAKEEDKAS